MTARLHKEAEQDKLLKTDYKLALADCSNPKTRLLMAGWLQQHIAYVVV